MTKTILVCGHGPGISDAVARKFGAEGFSVAFLGSEHQACFGSLTNQFG